MANAYETYLLRKQGTQGSSTQGSGTNSYQTYLQKKQQLQKQVSEQPKVEVSQSKSVEKKKETFVSKGVERVKKTPLKEFFLPTSTAFKLFIDTIADKTKPAREEVNKTLTKIAKEGFVSTAYAPAEEGQPGEIKQLKEEVVKEREEYRKTPAGRISHDLAIAVGSFAQGLTGGILKTEYEPQGLEEKIVSGVSNVVGSIATIRSISTKFGQLALGNTTVANIVKQYPKVSKWAIPLISNVVGFDVYGQLDPDQKERFKTLAYDTALGVVTTPLGFIGKARYSVPLNFGLGFGLAKLSGAEDEDAFIMGGILAGLDITGRATRSLFQQQIMARGGSWVVSPDEAIESVLSSQLKNTPQGRGIIKNAILAKSQGKNVKISVTTRKETTMAKELVKAKVPFGGEITVELVDTAPGLPEAETKIVKTGGELAKPVKTPVTVNVPLASGVMGSINIEPIGKAVDLFRGAKDQTLDVSRDNGITGGVSMSEDSEVAKRFADKVGGTVVQYSLSPDAMVVNHSDLEKMTKEEVKKFLAENDVDAIRFDVPEGAKGESEIRIINKDVIKEVSPIGVEEKPTAETITEGGEAKKIQEITPKEEKVVEPKVKESAIREYVSTKYEMKDGKIVKVEGTGVPLDIETASVAELKEVMNNLQNISAEVKKAQLFLWEKTPKRILNNPTSPEAKEYAKKMNQALRVIREEGSSIVIELERYGIRSIDDILKRHTFLSDALDKAIARELPEKQQAKKVKEEELKAKLEKPQRVAEKKTPPSPTGKVSKEQAQKTTPLPKTPEERRKAIEEYINKKGVKFRTDDNKALVNLDPTRKLTTKFFQHPDITGKEYLSYSFISNLARSTSVPLKQVERDVIQQVLDKYFPGEKKIPMAEFKRLVVSEMLPLDIIKSSTYADYGMSNLGFYESDYTPTTYILNSTFEHGETGHFPSDFAKTVAKESLEIREIPKQLQLERGVPTAGDKFAVVFKDVELTEENIEQNVFTVAESREKAQEWIDEHTLERTDEEDYPKMAVRFRKKGLFAHFRAFDDKEGLNVSNIAEIQSDPFQKSLEDMGITGRRENAERSIRETEGNLESTKIAIKNDTKHIEQLKNLQKLIKDGTVGKKIKEYVAIFDNSVASEKARKEFVEENKLNEEDIFRMERYFNVENNKFYSEDAGRFVEDRINQITDLLKGREEDVVTMESRLAEQKKELVKLTGEPLKEEKLFFSYKNIWQERVIREIINIKANEGFNAIRFPTPRTIALIEGFVSGEYSEDGEFMPYEVIEAQDEENLTYGDKINYGGEDYTVVNAETYEIIVAPSENVHHFDSYEARREEVENIWAEVKYEFELLEKGFGTIDTSEKAQKVFDGMATLQKLSAYSNIKQDVERRQTWFENSQENGENRVALKKWQEDLVKYEKFLKLLKENVIRKENITSENIDNLEFKDKLAEKYGVEHAYWNYIYNTYHYGDGHDFKTATTSTIEKINERIKEVKDHISEFETRLADAEVQKDNEITSIKERKKPTPAELKGIPKDLIEKAKKGNSFEYDYYETGEMLEKMMDVEDSFTIDDFEEDITQIIDENYEPDFEGSYGDGKVFYEDKGGYSQEVWVVTEGETESFQQPGEYQQVTSVEDFNIDDFSGDQKTVLLFYEKQVIPYLQKIRKDNLSLMTDDNGNQWYATLVTDADKQPPTAYRIKDDLAKVGIEITDKQEQEIIELNRKIFGDTSVKVTEQILTNSKALGSYSDKIIKILDKQVNHKDTFYHEAVHKYIDVFLEKEEHISLLEEAQRVYQIDDLAQVEEKLAEDFVRYANKRESVFGKIRALFDKLFKRIKAYFKERSRIDKLYEDILSGKAKYKIKPTKAIKPEEVVAEVTKLELPHTVFNRFSRSQEPKYVKPLIDRLQLLTILNNSQEFRDNPVLTVKEGKDANRPDLEKVFVYEGEKLSFVMNPDALQVTTRNLKVGDTIEVDREALKKGVGISQTRIYKGEEVMGFNPKNLEDPFSTEAKKETEKIVKQSDIAKTLSEKLNVPIRRGKFQARGAIGVFKPKPKVVRVKRGGLNTIFHEVGHYLDDKFKLSDAIDITERKALMTEYGYAYEGQAKKQRKEALAEYLRYRLTGQDDKIAEYAPEFNKVFNKRLEDLPDVKEVLEVAREDYSRWQSQPATAKVLSQLSIGKQKGQPLKEKISYNLHNLYTQAVDDLHPLSEFSELAKKKVGKLEAERDPYILARNLRGWVGKADLFLNKGTFGKEFWKVDDKGKVRMNYTGKSYKEIMKPLEKAGVMDDFRVYIVAQRIVNDLAPRGIITGISARDAKEALDELNKKYPEFEKIAEERRAYKDRLLEFAKDNGLIGEEGLAKMKELNKYHVPFYRVMEETSTQFLGKKKFAGNMASPIKRIKGSEREIIDPIESDIKDTYAIINASERNNIGIAMANLADRDYELGRLFEKVSKPMKPITVNVEEVLEKALATTGMTTDDIPEDLGEMAVTLFRPMQDRGINMLNVNFGDNFEVYQVDPDLFKAIQGLNAEDVSTILRIMSIPAKTLRAGATLTPDFSVRNPIRDQFTAYVYSKYGFIPGVDLVRGIFELLKQGDVYDLWKAGGGEHSMFVSLDRDVLQKNYKDLMRSKGSLALSALKHPIGTLRIISELGEAGTRLGEAKRALAKGATPIESAFASRNITLDFARIGAKTKAVNAIVAFFNANLQGTDTMVRNFKNHPFRTLLKVLLGITLPSILLYFANRKDPRWKEIPAWQKNLFWIILTPKHIIRIPKPFELGVIFGSVPERVLEVMDEKDPYAFDELEKAIISGFTPGFLPTSIIPIIENITNYSFFLDRPILSQGKEGLPPEQQANTYTSETAKVIGEALNYSPAKIDNLITGYTGGLGKYAVNALDEILKGTNIVNVPTAPALNLEDRPVVKAFLIRKPIGSQSESVNRVYDMYAKAEPRRSYANKLVKDGKEEEAKEYVKKHPEIFTAKILGATVDQFSDMNKAITNIRNSRELSREEKRNKIQEIQELQTEMAQKTIQYLKDNNLYE